MFCSRQAVRTKSVFLDGHRRLPNLIIAVVRTESTLCFFDLKIRSGMMYVECYAHGAGFRLMVKVLF